VKNKPSFNTEHRSEYRQDCPLPSFRAKKFLLKLSPKIDSRFRTNVILNDAEFGDFTKTTAMHFRSAQKILLPVLTDQGHFSKRNPAAEKLFFMNAAQ
jgi:hypothetical protein